MDDRSKPNTDPHDRGEVTQLLSRLNDGEKDAMDRLIELIYDEMHRLAAGYLKHERIDHTLQPTALVNEAYMKLVDQREAKWESRGHFLAIAATSMRRILANHARDRKRLKRGGDRRKIDLDANSTVVAAEGIDLVELNEALTRLSELDPRKVQVVEMRYYIGLGVDETARALNISQATVKRDWDFARTWLLREMQNDD